MLKYTWSKLALIFLEAKKKYNLKVMSDVLELLIQDVEVFELFIREGADLKDTKAARSWMDARMEEIGFEGVQMEIIEALAAANFYREKLEAIKKATTSKTQEEDIELN